MAGRNYLLAAWSAYVASGRPEVSDYYMGTEKLPALGNRRRGQTNGSAGIRTIPIRTTCPDEIQTDVQPRDTVEPGNERRSGGHHPTKGFSARTLILRRAVDPRASDDLRRPFEERYGSRWKT